VRSRLDQPRVQACPCAKRLPIGLERHLRSLLVAAAGMRAVADCPGAQRIADVSDSGPTQFLFSVNRTDGSFVIRWTKPWSKMHDPSDANLQMEAIKGPVSSIVEYTGHCELKHVETKF
jgi:hypothetical protein